MRDVIIRDKERVEKKNLPGGIDIYRLIEGEDLIFGIASASPGNGETWHEHVEEFEEIYYTLSGQGHITWKEDGERKETTVSAGEAFLCPKGGFENQIEAVGDQDWVFAYAFRNLDVDSFRKE